MIKARPGLRSKFLAVGFSRDHDAAFMNKIANFGNEVGNFIYIDAQVKNWQLNLQQSLLDSLQIAIQSWSAKAKFVIAVGGEEQPEVVKAEIKYSTT